MRIDEDGNVGIGTASPRSLLTLGDITYPALSPVTIEMRSDAVVRLGPWELSQEGGGSDVSYFRLDRWSNNVKSHMIAVDWAGQLYAKEVQITLSGPLADFVFDKDYDLISLSDVEAFIKKHHHLPGVPSEAEVKKNRLNLGEFSSLLLKKIEELTLYAIKQNKKIKEMEEDIQKLKNKNNEK